MKKQDITTDGFPVPKENAPGNRDLPKEDKNFLTQTIRNSAGVLVTDIGKEDENGIPK